MVRSQNSVVDLSLPATSGALATYGSVMVGDRAFEFYNERKPEDCIQIPWDEVDRVAASVLLGGAWIPRFAIITKRNGTFSFSTRDNKRLLRAVRSHVPEERLVRSLGFFDVIRLGVKHLLHVMTGHRERT